MQFMANIREYFIQTNSVQVIFTCNFSQRQSKNHFCLEPFLSSIPRNGKYISCCKIFEYLLLSYASFFLPNRRNSFVQRFCDWSCFNCLGELANNFLFALKKRLRKKSLFLVVNMAFADVMLGAVSLPFFVFLVVGLPYQLWSISYDLQLVLDSFYIAFDVIFSHASVMSAVFISCERFYAVNWPLKRRTLSSKAYAIIITIIWTLAIIAGAVYFLIEKLFSPKAALSVWAVVLYITVFTLCVCNIGIWRKFQKTNVAFSQQNRTVQNQRLTKPPSPCSHGFL